MRLLADRIIQVLLDYQDTDVLSLSDLTGILNDEADDDEFVTETEVEAQAEIMVAKKYIVRKVMTEECDHCGTEDAIEFIAYGRP